MIKAVIFDVDGVLIDSFEANLNFFQDLMKANGYEQPTREQYRKMFHMNMMHVIEKLLPNVAKEEHLRLWKMGKDRVIKHDSSLVQVPDDLKEVIFGLSATYKLGIVTSRVKIGVFEVPALKSLEESFETVIAFEDTTKHKPDPDPLLLAAKSLDVRAEECVYVGDTQTDVKAAQAAGMKIITYSKTKFDGVDAWTDEFGRIPELVEGLSRL